MIGSFCLFYCNLPVVASQAFVLDKMIDFFHNSHRHSAKIRKKSLVILAIFLVFQTLLINFNHKLIQKKYWKLRKKFL